MSPSDLRDPRASEQETTLDRFRPDASDSTAPPGLRVALVALPWSRADRPSPAIAALLAHVRRHRPDVRVKGHYEFLSIADAIGRELYHQISEDCYLMGELLYTPLLYPERSDAVRQEFVRWVAGKAGGRERLEDKGTGEELYALIQETLHQNLNRLATELVSFDVVGLTTCFGQLFGNIALADRLKRIAPDVKIVLGGSTISSRVGPSILKEYPAIDFIVQGEGERPFVALLASLGSKAAGGLDIVGLLTRERPHDEDRGAGLSEVVSLDELPTPEYEEFARAAEQYGFDWTLAVEGSRGCWWDRARRTGNPKDTCYFCNQNLQWSGYREKSAAKVIAEIRELSDRYSNLKLFFPDNIVRHKGVVELAQGLESLHKQFEIFYEMRANIRPYEFLLMWEAGRLREQFGIANVRNCDEMKPGLPEEVWRRLKLFGLSFDVVGPAADWTPLRDAVAQWVKLYEQKGNGQLLLYRDGGSFLIVEDRRFGEFRQGRFSREEREIYLYCTEVRAFADIARRQRKLGLSEEELRGFLNRFVEYKIMFTEDDKYLSLAIATQPRLAAARIRAFEAFQQEGLCVVVLLADQQHPAEQRLDVVGLPGVRLLAFPDGKALAERGFGFRPSFLVHQVQAERRELVGIGQRVRRVVVLQHREPLAPPGFGRFVLQLLFKTAAQVVHDPPGVLMREPALLHTGRRLLQERKGRIHSPAGPVGRGEVGHHRQGDVVVGTELRLDPVERLLEPRQGEVKLPHILVGQSEIVEAGMKDRVVGAQGLLREPERLLANRYRQIQLAGFDIGRAQVVHRGEREAVASTQRRFADLERFLQHRQRQVELAGTLVARCEVLHAGQRHGIGGPILRFGPFQRLFELLQGELDLSCRAVGQADVGAVAEGVAVIGAQLCGECRVGFEIQRNRLNRVTQCEQRTAQRPLQPGHGRRIAHRLRLQLTRRFLESLAEKHSQRPAILHLEYRFQILEDRPEDLDPVLDLRQPLLSTGRLGVGDAAEVVRDHGGRERYDANQQDRGRHDPVAPQRLSQHVKGAVASRLDRPAFGPVLQIGGEVGGRAVTPLAVLGESAQGDGVQITIAGGTEPAGR